jgi:hypothetical protein
LSPVPFRQPLTARLQWDRTLLTVTLLPHHMNKDFFLQG